MAFSLFNFGAKAANTKNQVVEIPLKQIEPNRYQPRQVFDKVQIQELAHTIEEHGLLQPIILREYKAAKYEIIAGERRFRAATYLHARPFATDVWRGRLQSSFPRRARPDVA